MDFDYLDIDGLRKSEDTAYASRMYPVAGTSPDLYCPQIESAIMNTTIIPDYVDIDVVTGATSSTGNANELMAAGLESAVEGSTDVVLTQED